MQGRRHIITSSNESKLRSLMHHSPHFTKTPYWNTVASRHKMQKAPFFKCGHSREYVLVIDDGKGQGNANGAKLSEV